MNSPKTRVEISLMNGVDGPTATDSYSHRWRLLSATGHHSTRHLRERASGTVAVAPSVSARLTDANLHALRQHGVKTVSLSLDGGQASTHDAVRGIDGHFDDTLKAVATLKRCGFTVQINTTVMATTIEELAEIAVLVHDMAWTCGSCSS